MPSITIMAPEFLISNNLVALRGMSGSSTLGKGKITLGFDANSLCRLLEQAPGSTASTPPF